MAHSALPAADGGIPLTRRRAAALSDAELVVAMGTRDPMAWAEWDLRFRMPLEQYARRSGIPRWDAAVYVAEVIEREGMRLAFRQGELPGSMMSYLRVAVRNRFLTARRVSHRRADAHRAAAWLEPDGVVRSASSEAARRASAGPLADDSRPIAVANFARWLERDLAEDDRALLGWIAEHVPRRTIAAWLGVSYEAAKKRCTRLCARVRATASSYLRQAPPEDRDALRFFLARAGIDVTALEVGHDGP